ncbi:MAG: 50S ribosomal protein L11 methyltransferase [Staphylothermus sp.]|nr:50S ribosomal protein L11 methyltransferase [Staphylothermus sp.]
MDKKSLELLLEKLPRYPFPRRELEQYETPSWIVAHVVWYAFMKGDIFNKIVLDLGCGSFRFGYAALVLGARSVIGVDIDDNILQYAMKNLSLDTRLFSGKYMFINADVRELVLNQVDTVVMNPPFGVYRKNRGLDLLFLNKAFKIASSVYTIHKFSYKLDSLVQELAEMNGFKILHREIINFEIPMLFETHRRKVYRVKTVFYVIRKEV